MKPNISFRQVKVVWEASCGKFTIEETPLGMGNIKFALFYTGTVKPRGELIAEVENPTSFKSWAVDKITEVLRDES